MTDVMSRQHVFFVVSQHVTKQTSPSSVLDNMQQLITCHSHFHVTHVSQKSATNDVLSRHVATCQQQFQLRYISLLKILIIPKT